MTPRRRRRSDTSPALRHYGAEGLLEPRRVAANGYRFDALRTLVTGRG